MMLQMLGIWVHGESMPGARIEARHAITAEGMDTWRPTVRKGQHATNVMSRATDSTLPGAEYIEGY